MIIWKTVTNFKKEIIGLPTVPKSLFLFSSINTSKNFIIFFTINSTISLQSLHSMINPWLFNYRKILLLSRIILDTQIFILLIHFLHYALFKLYISSLFSTLQSNSMFMLYNTNELSWFLKACSVANHLWCHNLNFSINLLVWTTSPSPTIYLDCTLMMHLEVLIKLI